MSTDIRQEIEKIIKEINRRWAIKDDYFYRFEYKALHYKKKNERLDYTHDYDQMRQIIFDPELEYALYIELTQREVPSYCLSGNRLDFLDYFSAMEQFIPRVRCDPPPYKYCERVVDYEFVKNVIRVKPLYDNKDPLSQVFKYKRILSRSWPSNVYVCSRLYIIEPHSSDITSIFHGKVGAVAYCMTLRDLVIMESLREDVSFAKSIDNIWSRIFEKACSHEVQELWNQDRMKACDIDTIKRIMSAEIEYAESLMKQYGIVRVTAVLGKL